MAEFGTLPVDGTLACFAALLNAVESGSVWQAQERMAGDIDRQLVDGWFRLQTALGERLQQELDAGRITDDQFDFALELLSRLDQYPHEEAVEQFATWAEWVRGG